MPAGVTGRLTGLEVGARTEVEDTACGRASLIGVSVDLSGACAKVGMTGYINKGLVVCAMKEGSAIAAGEASL